MKLGLLATSPRAQRYRPGALPLLPLASKRLSAEIRAPLRPNLSNSNKPEPRSQEAYQKHILAGT